MSKGKFIAIEGIDGSGKTTIVNELKTIYPDIVTTRMPGGTDFSESIRDTVRNADVSKEVQTLLYSASILDNLLSVVTPKVNRGINVISDRCFLSTFVYQAIGTIIEKPLLELIKNTQLCKPDLIIFVDISLDKALERENGIDRKDVTDRYSRMDIDRKKSIYDNYQNIVKSQWSDNSSMIKYHIAENIVCVNGDQPLEKVIQDIQFIIDPIM